MSDDLDSTGDDRPSDVLGALPRTRPHRRSDKRAARPEQAKAAPAAAKAKPKAPAAAKAKPTTPAAAKRKPQSAAQPKPPAAAGTNAKPRAAPGPKPRAAPGGKPRAAPAGAAKPADAARTRLAAPPAKPARSRRNDALGTAVQAAAELAEIGLTASARAIRRAVSRLPRP